MPLCAFYRRIQPERVPFFQSTASFRWKCVRFQRTTAALDLPERQIAPLCLCVCVCSQINTAQHTSIWGFSFFGGGLWGETECYISLHSQLFTSHSRSTWDSYESLSVNGRVGVNAWKFVASFFSAGIYFTSPPPPPPPQNTANNRREISFSSRRLYEFGFDDRVSVSPDFLNYNKEPGASTLALLR